MVIYVDEPVSGRASVRCADCNARGFEGGRGQALRHSSRCAFAPRQTVAIPSGGAAALNAAVVVKSPAAPRIDRTVVAVDRTVVAVDGNHAEAIEDGEDRRGKIVR